MRKCQQVNVAQWKDYMARCTATTSTWWDALTFPTEADLSELHVQLTELFKIMPLAPASSATFSASDAQEVLQPWPATPSSSIPFSLRSQYLGPGPEVSQTAQDDALGDYCPDTMPGCPSMVMRSLLAAARIAQEHAENTFRQGHINRVNVMSLEDRLAVVPPNLPFHGHQSKPHAWSVEEGSAMGILFSLLLEDFKISKIIERVQPGFGGLVPAACGDPLKFHRVYSCDFKKNCGAQSFEELSASEQRAKLTTFLFAKFSTDPFGKRMVPENGKRRKTLSWTGFYITDDELPRIVERVMIAYENV